MRDFEEFFRGLETGGEPRLEPEALDLQLLTRIVRRMGSNPGKSLYVDLIKAEKGDSPFQWVKEVVNRAKAGGADEVQAYALRSNDQSGPQGRAMRHMIENLPGFERVPNNFDVRFPVSSLEDMIQNKQARKTYLELMRDETPEAAQTRRVFRREYMQAMKEGRQPPDFHWGEAPVGEAAGQGPRVDPSTMPNLDEVPIADIVERFHELPRELRERLNSELDYVSNAYGLRTRTDAARHLPSTITEQLYGFGAIPRSKAQFIRGNESIAESELTPTGRWLRQIMRDLHGY